MAWVLPVKSIAKGLPNTFLVYSYITNRRISIPSIKLGTPKEGTSTPFTLKSSNYFKPILNINIVISSSFSNTKTSIVSC